MIAKAFIEITNICNLACPFCPPTQRPAASMTQDQFATILERLKGRVTLLYFHLKGEPLLHPLLKEFLDRAHHAGFPVHLSTNGSFLKTQGETLLTAPALKKISISLQSHVALGSQQESYCSEIHRFIQRRRERSGPSISLRLWNLGDQGLSSDSRDIIRHFATHYPHLESALDDLLADMSSEPPQNRGRFGIPGIRLEQGVYLNLAREFSWPRLAPWTGQREAGPLPSGRCHGLRTQFGILADGTVVPCCLDGDGAIALGNIFNAPLEAILARPRARAIREGFAKNQLIESLCLSCGYRKLNQAYWKGAALSPQSPA